MRQFIEDFFNDFGPQPPPGFLGPRGAGMGDEPLSQLEIGNFLREFRTDPALYTPSQVRQALGINPELRSDMNSVRGIRDLAPAQLEASGIPGEGCGCSVKSSSLRQGDYSQDNATTFVPQKWKMRHQRVAQGNHAALIGNRIILNFPAKKACNAFVRAWNATMSHLGQAATFLPSDLVQAFSDVVIAGSGTYGLQNDFSPPFKGRLVT